MRVKFNEVITPEQITELAAIANEVWHQHFITILTLEQIDYMVDKFQSDKALTDQIKNKGYEYYFINLDGKNIGYVGLHRETEKLFLSKLYILQPYRGNGYASEAFEFMENICKQYHLKSIYLTVNRFNTNTINVYKKKDFVTIKTQVADIGNGFVMDDYIMEKTVE